MTAQLKTKSILTILIISFLIFIIAKAEPKVPNDGLGWKTADWDEEHPGGANWAWEFIKLPSAWNFTTGSKDVKIGVIDLGFDIKHEDLRDNIDPTISPKPIDEHGTAVAGIIGAKGNNGIGISGVMWDVNLLLYSDAKIPFTDRFYQPRVMQRMAEAISAGARIINYSAGTTHCLITCSETFADLENAAWKRFLLNTFKGGDVTFVFAAGEDNVDDKYSSPSSIAADLGYDHVISVTNSDRSGDLNQAAQANFGEISVAAPGDEIMTTVPIGSDADDDTCFGSNIVDGYGCFAGTSFSAPFVSGLAGLIYSVDPAKYEGKYKGKVLAAKDVKELIVQGAINGNRFVSGPEGHQIPIINAYESLKRLVTSPLKPITCPVSGIISEDSVIHQDQSPCVIQGSLTIPSGVIFAIDPGVVIKFAYSYSELIINGTLNANGTASQPIYLTSIKDDSVGGDTNNDGSASTPAPKDWQDIVINSTGAANFNYSTIRFGGSGNTGFYLYGGNLSLTNSRLTQISGWHIWVNSGIASITSSEIDHSHNGILQAGGTVTVSQSSIHDNVSDGIFATAGTLAVTSTNFQKNNRALFVSPVVNFTHSNNTATDNGINGIVMSGSTVTDSTWTKDLIPYVIYSGEATSTVIISPNTTLTIDPGVVIKFAYSYSELIINGTLNANGTASQPIYLTSIKDDSVGGDTNNDGSATSPAPRDWAYITINSTGTANFNYSTIRFGSFGNLFGGNLSLSHSHLTQTYGWPVWVGSGIANITSSEIDHNFGGILQAGGTVTVSQSSIHDNTTYGAFSGGPNIIMNARNNWWGDSTGPYHPTLNPGGLGNPVSDNVDFIPFLTSDPVGSLP